ncbi:hypothetical protein DDT91_03910 [Algoriphagus sp. AK58]|nr:hypothetical protein [Algoriphagus sp. AK58]
MHALFEFVGKSKNLFFLGFLFLSFNFLLFNFMPKEYALDLKFAYTAEEAYLALGHLDQAQREYYRIGVWALDMPYMVIYTLFFIGVLNTLWNSRRFVGLPVGILVMDFFENILILKILKIYPRQDELLVMTASCFSTVKWLLVGFLLILIVAGILSWINQRGYSHSKSSEVRL